jgi:glutamine amidotransferase
LIVILDYGMGNPASISNMLRKVGAKSEISMEIEAIKRADAIILPGVGAFDNGITKIKASGVLELIEDKVLNEKKPFLGICLGMQLLFEESEEGNEPGLGWLSGSVKRFNFSSLPDSTKYKIPHMGWNSVETETASSSLLFEGLETGNRFYFVHSFHAQCQDSSNVSGTTHYGYDFACAVQKENIFGVQFHPEKSHRFGMAFFKNFTAMALC